MQRMHCLRTETARRLWTVEALCGIACVSWAFDVWYVSLFGVYDSLPFDCPRFR